MAIYFALLLVVTLVVYLSQRMEDRVGSFLTQTFAFVSLVLVSGLRSGDVGSDSLSYIRRFEDISELADIWKTNVDPGLGLLSWIGKQVSNDYVVLFTLVAMVVTLCFLLGIRKLSVNPALSVFVLLTSGSFFFSFNGLRQGTAIAIFFLAIGAIYQRRLWLFLVCIAAASFFHSSAVMALPTYFMVPRKNDFRFNILIFGLAAASFWFFTNLIDLAGLLNPRYSQYGAMVESGQGRGLVYAAFLCAMGGFFLYFKRHVQQHRSLYDLLLNLYLLGLVIVALTVLKQTSASGIMRVSGYLSVSQVLIWPIVFANVQNRGNRRMFLSAFVFMYLVYYGMTLQAFGQLVPYSFNPSVQIWFSTLF